MFDKPYQFQFLGYRKAFLTEPSQKIHYRFKAQHRTYFVTLEIFSYGIAAIKYCDVKDKESKKAYNKRIYRYAMIDSFAPTHFTDNKNCQYVLPNKK